MSGIKVGDEVRVFTGNRYRRSCPEDGWHGTVTKAGRKWATAKYEYSYTDPWGTEPVTGTATVEFDMVSGYERGWTGGSAPAVRTPAQLERDRREAHTVKYLLSRKIRLDYGHGFTLEQIEALANVARSFTENGD